ncbi:hypothetical protein BHM03_00013177 [Ensete ventricosum]|nr:hypothetical protein BHM03_00013177 [Ensete ventricosum]
MFHEHAVPWYLPCADLYEGSAMLLEPPLRSTHHDLRQQCLRVNPCLRSMRCAVGAFLSFGRESSKDMKHLSSRSCSLCSTHPKGWPTQVDDVSLGCVRLIGEEAFKPPKYKRRKAHCSCSKRVNSMRGGEMEEEERHQRPRVEAVEFATWPTVCGAGDDTPLSTRSGRSAAISNSEVALFRTRKGRRVDNGVLCRIRHFQK